ncbi:hypothetical protein L227DRAFT_357542 [Lentinus tigrinus ALCF2SS1-6]|uniref:Uncharacterized protein n=1 Tax=Lentinus tigrinus ALCF2SS1-6 TaxID=1328759 RepID=A0A5C2SKI6_9APHY|nr:hypothetical protein L227DRAFT_357542 [Lentinus tigrinus ALCF2SS1-6]
MCRQWTASRGGRWHSTVTKTPQSRCPVSATVWCCKENQSEEVRTKARRGLDGGHDVFRGPHNDGRVSTRCRPTAPRPKATCPDPFWVSTCMCRILTSLAPPRSGDRRQFHSHGQLWSFPTSSLLLAAAVSSSTPSALHPYSHTLDFTVVPEDGATLLDLHRTLHHTLPRPSTIAASSHNMNHPQIKLGAHPDLRTRNGWGWTWSIR